MRMIYLINKIQVIGKNKSNTLKIISKTKTQKKRRKPKVFDKVHCINVEKKDR